MMKCNYCVMMIVVVAQVMVYDSDGSKIKKMSLPALQAMDSKDSEDASIAGIHWCVLTISYWDKGCRNVFHYPDFVKNIWCDVISVCAGTMTWGREPPMTNSHYVSPSRTGSCSWVARRRIWNLLYSTARCVSPIASGTPTAPVSPSPGCKPRRGGSRASR